MLMDEEFYNSVSRIIQEDPRYHPDAYVFVMEALGFAQKKFKQPKHVSGHEFLEGIKGLLIKQFGPLTLAVLDHWGIKKTDDFGNIVHNLEQFKIIARNNDDQYDVFKNGYDFQEVFDKGYRKQLAKRIKTMRF